jgi:hypothetical protein
MPHYNLSTRERVIALVEKGNLTAVEASRRYGVLDRNARRLFERYWDTGELVGPLVQDFGV